MIAPEIITAANAKKKQLKSQYPALYFMPNVGQERAFLPYREPPYPYIMVFGGGNGVGKTAALAVMLVGCCFGKVSLPPFFDDYKFFDDLQEKHKLMDDNEPLRYRIICHADSMKDNGSVLQAIQKWFPRGRYKLNKNGKTYYSEILCDNGTVIDVKTHDQDPLAHAGTTLDGIFCDEPPPEAQYGEMVGRTRNGGFMMFFLTPLEMAAWMLDQIIEPADGSRVVITNASLWENCKDIPGTRGLLTRNAIENMIMEWTRISPHEVEARVEGKFSHLSGAIWKNWNPDVHLIRPFPIPPSWPVYRIIDPHDSKPPAIFWAAQSPTNMFVFREWPTADFTKLGPSEYTIRQIVQLGKDIEQPFRSQVVWPFMDPNKGKFVYSNSNKTVQQEYSEAGWDFELSEDNLQVGHQRVSAMLDYNRNRPVEVPNVPYLYVFDDCKNTANALHKYGIKRNAVPGTSLTAQVDKKYKDFADLVRYLAMRVQPYQDISFSNQFYDVLMSGRG